MTGKRVLLVGNTAWSMYNFRRGLIEALVEEKWQVLVAAPKDDYSFDIINLGATFIPLLQLNNKGTNPLDDYKFYRELKGIYCTARPNFIFHYTIKPNIYGTLAATSLTIPSIAITTGLGYVFSSRNLLFNVVKLLYKLASTKSKEVWFLNSDDRDSFVGNGICPGSKTLILPGEGVNTNYFQPTTTVDSNFKREITFLLIARMIYDKGVQDLVDAARILKQEGYEFTVQLLGFLDVKNPNAISKEQMNSWVNEGLVEYLGETSNVIPHIQKSDCVVLPSYYGEGIPRTLMEGASMGKPLITTNNVGCRELVDHEETGYLCQPKNPEDLAEKLRTFIELTDEDRKEMGLKGRRKMIDQFDEKAVVNIYLKKLNEYLNERVTTIYV